MTTGEDFGAANTCHACNSACVPECRSAHNNVQELLLLLQLHLQNSPQLHPTSSHYAPCNDSGDKQLWHFLCYSHPLPLLLPEVLRSILEHFWRHEGLISCSQGHRGHAGMGLHSGNFCKFAGVVFWGAFFPNPRSENVGHHSCIPQKVHRN